MNPPILPRALATLALVLLAGHAPAAESPSEWAWTQSFRSPTAGAVRIALPIPLLDAAHGDLADLRLLDAAGQPVAFVIEHPAPAETRSPRSFRVTVEKEATVALLETGATEPIGGVLLDSPVRGFLKAVTVEGSQDAKAWKVLEERRPVFRHPSGEARPEITFEPAAWRWLRVTLDDHRSPPIPLTSASLRVVRGAALPLEAVPVEIVDRSEEEGATRLVLRLPAANLTLTEIGLDTPESVFSHEVSLAELRCVEGEVREVELARGLVQRLPESAAGPALVRFERGVKAPSRELVLVLRHDDSPPLQVNGVRARRRVTRLLCVLPQSGEYRFLAGNPVAVAPRHDLERLQDRLRDAPAIAATFSPLAPNPTFAPTAPLASAPTEGAALDPKDWPFRKPVRLDKGGVQALELDLDVLAKSYPSLHDLRLLRGGRQVPWVIERTSASRSLHVVATPADDPKRPSVSRWKLALPAKRIPIARLSCATPAAIFQREFTLQEEVPDERGEMHRRFHASGSWTGSASSRREITLALGADFRPETNTLLLEVDNGDNPPIVLSNFKARHPVVRVLFMADPGRELFLYYGLPSAPSPRYDLALVAPRLMAVDRHATTLGPEEALKDSAMRNWVGGRAGVFFWGALVLAVAVLLVVIARLLPAAPTPKA